MAEFRAIDPRGVVVAAKRFCQRRGRARLVHRHHCGQLRAGLAHGGQRRRAMGILRRHRRFHRPGEPPRKALSASPVVGRSICPTAWFRLSRGCSCSDSSAATSRYSAFGYQSSPRHVCAQRHSHFAHLSADCLIARADHEASAAAAGEQHLLNRRTCRSSGIRSDVFVGPRRYWRPETRWCRPSCGRSP